MAPTVHKLHQLAEQHQPVHGTSRSTDLITRTIGGSILEILYIVSAKSPTDLGKFEDLLNGISHFFRVENFSKTILPVLENLSDDENHKEFWTKSRYSDTNMPVTPKLFENLKKSTAGEKDQWGQSIPSIMDREKLLLSIYGISMERIGEIFHKNKAGHSSKPL